MKLSLSQISKISIYVVISLSSCHSPPGLPTPDDDNGGLLIEGTLGDFLSYSILEDKLLEVKCTDGILRLELNESMLNPFLPHLSV